MAQRSSHTKRTALKSCARKAYLSYELGLSPKAKRPSQVMGSAFSVALEHWDASRGDAEFMDYLRDAESVEEREAWEEARGVVRILAAAYMERYPRDAEAWPEYRFEYEAAPDVIDVGAMDSVEFVDGELVIVENKLLAMWSQAHEYALALNSQVTAYLRAARAANLDVRKVLFRVTMKPSIRRRKGRGKDAKPESLAEYLDRLEADVASRPEHYFREFSCYRTQAQLDESVEDVAAIGAEWDWRRERGVWPMSEDRCGDYGGCYFLGLCRREPGAAEKFNKRRAREQASGNG